MRRDHPITRLVEIARFVDDVSLATGVASRYGVSVLDAGAFDFWYRGRVSTLAPGAVKLKQPGEVHRDLRVHAAVTGATVSFAPRFVEACAEELGVTGAPGWRDIVSRDGRAERLARRVVAASEPLARESHATALIAHLVHAQLGRAVDDQPSHRPAAVLRGPAKPGLVRGPCGRVDRARELLRARVVAPPSLDELARSVGLGKFALLRGFRAAVGLTPYAYVLHLRVSLARDLLAAGWSVAAAALEVGFCDQSQLHRHFRRIVGVTPGVYARARVQ